MKFFSKRPGEEQNFFQNYVDHVCFLMKKLDNKMEALAEAKPKDFFDIAVIQNGFFDDSIFDAYRDGHDFMDDIAGATVVPFFLFSTAVVSPLISLGLFLSSLVIKWDFDDDEDTSLAVKSLHVGYIALIFAAVNLGKSAISLFTRSFTTVFQGFKARDEYRFYGERTDREIIMIGAEAIGII